MFALLQGGRSDSVGDRARGRGRGGGPAITRFENLSPGEDLDGEAA